MARVKVGGSSGGILSDDVTSKLSDVAKGKTAVTSDSNDEPGVGTLELTGNAGTGDVLNGATFYNNDLYTKRTGTLRLTGNATAAYVLNGYTFYNTNAKSKITGTMTVNSLLSFSVAVVSGRRVTATWRNPNQAAGRPYSGVYIKYSTSGNPGKGGTQIYKGAGNNTTSGGTSTASFNLPNLRTKYYLSIYPYVTCSAGEMTGSVLNASVTTGNTINLTYTSSGTYTIPQGYTKMDVFAVGGGGAGAYGRSSSNDGYGSGGGGGGYTKTVKNIVISGGQSLAITVGAGGSTHGGDGGDSSVSRSGTVLITASGGDGASTSSAPGIRDAGNGGSGGGSGGGDADFNDKRGGDGGSDGGNGKDPGNIAETYWAGFGQGTTTRAWGLSSGTLYAGGGGGGCTNGYNFYPAGGAGGGGHGGSGRSNDQLTRSGENGSANTGGGGGGGGGYSSGGDTDYGKGGSGIVLIKIY